MKKILMMVCSVFIFFVFTNSVKAEHEYRVYLNGPSNIVVRRTIGNTSNEFQTVSNYSDILSFSDNVLTLNEGYYFDLISIRYSGVTITSNNKHVYLNTIFDANTNTNSLRNVTIDKLYSNSFESSFESLQAISGQKIYSMIYISGSLTITNSNIDISNVNPKAVDIYYNGNITSNYSDLTVLDSTIVAEGGLASGDGGSYVVKNSSFTAKTPNGYGYIFGTTDGPATIENCTFNGNIGLYLTGDSTITDSVINLPDFNAYNINQLPNVVIRNTEMNLTKSFDLGYYIENGNNTYITSGIVTLDNTHVKLADNISVKVNNDSKLYLRNNSSIEAESVINEHGLESSLLSVENSNVKVKSIDIAGLVELEDSQVDLDQNGFINGAINVELTGLNDLNIKSISGGDISIDSTNVNLSGVLSGNDILVVDSTVNTYGTRATGDFTLSDSTYNTQTLSSEKGYSPLIVKGDLDVDNSRLIANSDGTVPALLVVGDIDINNELLINDNKNILEISNVVVSSNNFLPGGVTGNDTFVNEGDNVKTITLNGNISNYVETTSYSNIIIKIVNGTWADGTTEEKTIRVLTGEDIESSLPSDMIPNKGYKKGEWKLVDGEYVYTFVKNVLIENPKTGVVSMLGVLLITLILMFIYLYNKEKYSYFKKI